MHVDDCFPVPIPVVVNLIVQLVDFANVYILTFLFFFNGDWWKVKHIIIVATDLDELSLDFGGIKHGLVCNLVCQVKHHGVKLVIERASMELKSLVFELFLSKLLEVIIDHLAHTAGLALDLKRKEAIVQILHRIRRLGDVAL